MAKRVSVWTKVLDLLKAFEARLPREWPPELPPEAVPGFWWRALEYERQHRQALHGKICTLALRQPLPPFSSLEAWLAQRRIDWAAQFATEAVGAGLEPKQSPEDILVWVLVESWETDGVAALQEHAASVERLRGG